MMVNGMFAVTPLHTPAAPPLSELAACLVALDREDPELADRIGQLVDRRERAEAQREERDEQ